MPSLIFGWKSILVRQDGNRPVTCSILLEYIVLRIVTTSPASESACPSHGHLPSRGPREDGPRQSQGVMKRRSVRGTIRPQSRAGWFRTGESCWAQAWQAQAHQQKLRCAAMLWAPSLERSNWVNSRPSREATHSATGAGQHVTDPTVGLLQTRAYSFLVQAILLLRYKKVARPNMPVPSKSKLPGSGVAPPE